MSQTGAWMATASTTYIKTRRWSDRWLPQRPGPDQSYTMFYPIWVSFLFKLKFFCIHLLNFFLQNHMASTPFTCMRSPGRTSAIRPTWSSKELISVVQVHRLSSVWRATHRTRWTYAGSGRSSIITASTTTSLAIEALPTRDSMRSSSRRRQLISSQRWVWLEDCLVRKWSL